MAAVHSGLVNTEKRLRTEAHLPASQPEAEEVFIGFHGILSTGLNELVAKTTTNFLGRRFVCRPDVHFRGHQHFGAIAVAKDVIVSEIFLDGRRVLEGLQIKPSESGRRSAYEMALDKVRAGTEIRLRLANFAPAAFEFFATLQGETW